MKFINIVKKATFITLIYLVGIISAQTTHENCECDEPVNVWFKLSNDTSSMDYGKVIPIDMSKGFASTDGEFVYLLLQIDDGEDAMMITFPIGYWEIEQPSEFMKELEKEFKNLEDYLRSTQGNGTEIQKQ